MIPAYKEKSNSAALVFLALGLLVPALVEFGDQISSELGFLLVPLLGLSATLAFIRACWFCVKAKGRSGWWTLLLAFPVLGAIVFVLLKDHAKEQPVSITKPSFWNAVFGGVLLIVIDAFFLNQGGIALLVGLWMLLVGLPGAFLTKKYVTVRAERLRNIAVYFVAVILVFVFHVANNHLAQSRAETLISAVKAFHGKNQRYPKSLEELVPDYVERVPVAKYTFTFNRYYYDTWDRDASLFYVDFPPFGRPYYSFTRDAWGYLD